MSIASNRAALVALLTTASVRAFAYAPKSLPTPCAVVGFPTSYDAHDSFTSTAMIVAIVLYVGYGDGRAAEDELEALIDTVVAAVEADSDYSVTTVDEFGLVENSAGQPTALSCTVSVSVL